MRKLATIQKIEDVHSIENADSIEKVRIKGWWVVVKKDQFKINDKCVYFEIDSLLPNIPQFSFLAKGQTLKKSIIEHNKEIEGYRLKTVCLRKQISQGLAMPFSEFQPNNFESLNIDTDVSEILNVHKYEMPIPVHLSGEVKGAYPGIIPRTDEERIQNCIPLLEQYKGRIFYATSKIDGTSSTFYKYENKLGVCGHNMEFKENDKTIFWRLARQYDLKNKLPNNFAIQAETAGEGIQNNRLKLKGIDLFAFYVFDIVNQQYLILDDMKIFIKDLGLKTVPIVYDNFILNHTCEELLKLANVPSLLNPNLPQEGLVFRLNDSKEKISFKVISNDYLIKYGL